MAGVKGKSGRINEGFNSKRYSIKLSKEQENFVNSLFDDVLIKNSNDAIRYIISEYQKLIKK